ncbi:sensor histidine kinase [Sphingobacterium faecale]|uniref:histidine kinase n=1 Tax=Sphingobacterium faecale TaxID=2803775 RepID=A0ABS1R7K7_9SPHI|nr:ATP-binding protein [Sphingobacterium faecale]MBL1410689.1 hypothetical protein [Sphingobacterium faecale]
MRRVLICLLFSLFSLQVSAMSDTLCVYGANDIPIVGYLKEYTDCSHQLEFDDILQRWELGEFARTKAGAVINKGIADCTYWYSLWIKNEYRYHQDYLWNFYNDGIRFTLYQLDSVGNVENIDSISHQTAVSVREVPLRSLSFLISMDPQELKHLFLKVEPLTRKNIYFPTDISTYRDILGYELQFSFLLGRYYGFFFFAVIFNLFLFLVLKRRFYAVMLGYVVSLLAFNMVEYLHDVYIIPESVYPIWSKIPKQVFLAFTLYFNVLVFQDFVSLRKCFPQLDKLLIGMNRLVLVLTLLFLCHQMLFSNAFHILMYAEHIFVGILLIQSCLLIVVIFICVSRSVRYIYHYLAGVSLLLVSMFLYLLNTFDMLYLPQFVLPGNIIFAFAFEVVYLTIVFSVIYKREFDRFSKELLELYRTNKTLAKEVISVQEKERMRIGQDIHDGLGGAIHGLRLLLASERIQQKEKLEYFLTEIGADFRHLVHKLYPTQLKVSGLFECMKQDTVRYKGIKINLNCLGNDKAISMDLQISVYRMYQELLTNAIKHAEGCSIIDVSLAIEDKELRLMVEDNGSKRWQSEKDFRQEGVGLVSLQTRVDYHNGRMDVHSSNKGTSVVITIPLISNI